MTPRIGDIVLYRSHGTRDGRHEPAHLPLLVVEVEGFTTHPRWVSGWVYYTDGQRYHHHVPYGDDEAERATWFPKP